MVEANDKITSIVKANIVTDALQHKELEYLSCIKIDEIELKELLDKDHEKLKRGFSKAKRGKDKLCAEIQ